MDEREYQEKLGQVREEIDAIDKQLLPLFLARMDCSQQVARLKAQAGAPVFAPQREQAILDLVRKEAGEYGEEAASLYGSIMAVSRARQHRLLQGGGALRDLERSGFLSWENRLRMRDGRSYGKSSNLYTVLCLTKAGMEGNP